MSVHQYLGLFRREIEKLEYYGYAESLESREELRPNRQANIKVKAVLIDRSVLHIREYIDAKYGTKRLSYAYHYQDADGNLIFRYDNAMHKPALGFREHKHRQDGKVTRANLPNLSDLIDEIIGYL